MFAWDPVEGHQNTTVTAQHVKSCLHVLRSGVRKRQEKKTHVIAQHVKSCLPVVRSGVRKTPLSRTAQHVCHVCTLSGHKNTPVTCITTREVVSAYSQVRKTPLSRTAQHVKSCLHSLKSGSKKTPIYRQPQNRQRTILL